MPMLKVRGEDFHIRIDGDERAPVLLLSNSLGTTLEMWDAQAAKFSKDFRVTKEHGLFYDRNGILYMGTFHPAALLRNPNQKPAAFEDFIALRDKINEICDHTY